MASASSPLSEAYINENEGPRLIAIISVFIALEIGFIGLRVYSRSLGDARKGLDDILIWAAVSACLVLNVLGLVMVQYCGVGRHTAALTVLGESYKLIRWGKGIISMVPLYLLAVILPKLCVLVLYLRIFTQRVFRITCYVLVAIIWGNFIGGTVALLTSCIPLAKNWDPTLPGHCINSNAFYQWISFPNILTDIVILVLPLPFVWRLHTTMNQKAGLTATFSAGGVGLIISIIRFKTFFASDAFEDPTMTSIDLISWTVIEPGMYLIAACLVTLRPLLQLVIKERIMAITRGLTSQGYQLSSSANDNRKLQKSGTSVVNSIPLGQLPKQVASFSDDRELVQKDFYYGKTGTGTQAACVSSPGEGHLGSHQILVKHDYFVTSSVH